MSLCKSVCTYVGKKMNTVIKLHKTRVHLFRVTIFSAVCFSLCLYLRLQNETRLLLSSTATFTTKNHVAQKEKSRVKRIYFSSEQLFDKREKFNAYLDEYVRNLPSAKQDCKYVNISNWKAARVIQGYHKKPWNFAKTRLVGTPQWLERNRKFVQTMEKDGQQLRNIQNTFAIHSEIVELHKRAHKTVRYMYLYA